MRKRHRLVLVGGFTQVELEQVFKRRRVRIHTPLRTTHEDGVQEVEICFNPKHIRPQRIIEVLVTDRHAHFNVGIEPATHPEESCHDCMLNAA